MFLIWAIPLIIVIGVICAVLLKLLLKDAHDREEGRVLYDDQSGSE